MKLKIYFITIFVSIMLLTSLKGNPQNWAPIGATWYFGSDYTPCGPHSLPIKSYIKLVSEKDSIINGWNCKKIVVSNPNNDFKTNYFMYSDSNKVYEVENDQKYLLYDFNKKAGEYWLMPKYDNDSLFVDSIGTTTLLDGQIRKVQYVHLNGFVHHWAFDGIIIENIGNTLTFFPYRIGEITGSGGNGNYEERRCYFENNIALIKSNTPCDYQNIDEYPLEEKVIIKNPVSQQIRIEILDYRILPITNIVIYNSNGAIVYQKKENSNWIINFPNNTPGLYFLKLTFKNNQILFKKIIKC